MKTKFPNKTIKNSRCVLTLKGLKNVWLNGRCRFHRSFSCSRRAEVEEWRSSPHLTSIPLKRDVKQTQLFCTPPYRPPFELGSVWKGGAGLGGQEGGGRWVQRSQFGANTAGLAHGEYREFIESWLNRQTACWIEGRRLLSLAAHSPGLPALRYKGGLDCLVEV